MLILKPRIYRLNGRRGINTEAVDMIEVQIPGEPDPIPQALIHIDCFHPGELYERLNSGETVKVEFAIIKEGEE